MAPKPSAPSVAEEPPAVLRPLREGDVEAIASWLAKAVVLASSPVPLTDLLKPDGDRPTLVLTACQSQEPSLLVTVALDDTGNGWATVALLAMAAQEQRDLAAQAIALLEADLGHKARHIRAAVPLDVGLALYFWLRLGYRPIAADGRLWMIRDLEE